MKRHLVAIQGRLPLSVGSIAILFSQTALAAGLPSDEDVYRGDNIRLMATLKGFERADDANVKGLCALWGTRFAVVDQDATSMYVRVLEESILDSKLEVTAAEAICPHSSRVQTHVMYKISTDSVRHTDLRRSGVVFGGLVVPFKLRLGSDKHLVSSSTVAPFVGFRTGWVPFGLSLTPVIALGLSQVPVAKTGGGTETKAAYTVAAGLRITSSKNDKFSGGLVFGHDYLNKTDRAADPSVSKPWLSAYLGYSL